MWLWKAIDIEYLARHNKKLPDNLQKDIEGMSFPETANYFKTRFNLSDDIEVIK
jgi:16S rRNA pseudouridine516 synthase